MTFSDQILSFYKSLSLSVSLPDVEVMNPFHQPETFSICEKFYHQFYNDNNPRKIILGINPGRLGGGTTGIPFTDPLKLEEHCGITNNLPKKTELSADFIYKMMDAYGGPSKFYKQFFISAVCPLGFTRNGKNLNYYDDKALEEAVKPFIISTLQKQLTFPIDRNIAFCLGDGKNYKFLSKLNQEYAFFQKLVPLPHPRFIMQYRRKKLTDFIHLYGRKLSQPL